MLNQKKKKIYAQPKKKLCKDNHEYTLTAHTN